MTVFKRWIGLGTMFGLAAVLAGCGGMGTRTTENIASYAIYDVSPAPGVSAGKITDAIKQALRESMTSVNITSGIPPSPLPEKPGRFQLSNPFKGSALGALAGQALMMPACDGALVTAISRDSAMASYGENTMFFLCLLPYSAGFHVDIYVSFTRQSGGLDPSIMAATLMRPLTGDTGQFIPRTIQKIVKAIEGTGATTRLVEQYP
jgi:hypothetical protein